MEVDPFDENYQKTKKAILTCEDSGVEMLWSE
jgi:hypothetical protein